MVTESRSGVASGLGEYREAGGKEKKPLGVTYVYLDCGHGSLFAYMSKNIPNSIL